MRWVIRSRRRLMGLTAVVASLMVVTACSGGDSGGDEDSLTVQLSWFTNAQNGGWTAAVTEGYLAEAGFDKVELLAGGPNVSGIPLLASGRADIAVTTTESYLQARAQGVPVTAVYNEFDIAPTGILFKKENGWKDWEDLAGKSWTVAPISLGWQWVQQDLGIDFTTQNFNGSNAAFLAVPDGVTQGYPTNTVYEARQQGFDLDYLGYSTAGFNPYGQILVVSDTYAAEHGDELTRALGALSKGWQAYIGDTEAATTANAQMIKENDQLAEDVNWFTWDGQRKFVIGDAAGTTMGEMGDERWQTVIDQMISMGALPADFEADNLFDNQFVSPQYKWPSLEELPAAPAGVYEGPAPA